MNDKGKKVEVACYHCKKIFMKSSKEFNRSEKIGRKHFCGRSCCGHYHNTTNRERWFKPGSIKHLSGNKRDEFTPFRYFMKSVKYRETLKGKSDLTLEYLKELWERQLGICYFTGWKMVLPHGVVGYEGGVDSKSASLDRIDNTKGYVVGNVRFICLMANYARNNFTDNELIEFCKSVTDRNK